MTKYSLTPRRAVGCSPAGKAAAAERRLGGTASPVRCRRQMALTESPSPGRPSFHLGPLPASGPTAVGRQPSPVEVV